MTAPAMPGRRHLADLQERLGRLSDMPSLGESLGVPG